MDLNNKNLGTINSSIRKVPILTAMIMDLINNNQKIKRYLEYNTPTPLAKRYLDSSNVVINQPDVERDLTARDGGQRIYRGRFDPDTVVEKNSKVFVHIKNGKYRNFTGELDIYINILVPFDFQELASSGETRSANIANEIANMLDDMTLDDSFNQDYVEELGNLTFKLTEFVDDRLSNKSDMELFMLRYSVNITAIRVKES